MVISDGAPVDDSTLSSTTGLSRTHLRKVIDWIEKLSPVSWSRSASATT
jgi:cobaltochelatase CobT